jgi:hypothetical protein
MWARGTTQGAFGFGKSKETHYTFNRQESEVGRWNERSGQLFIFFSQGSGWL